MTDTVVIVSDATEMGGAERYLHTLITAGQSLRDVRFVVAVTRDVDPALTCHLEAAGCEVVGVPELSRRPRPTAIRAVLQTLRDYHSSALLVNLTDQGDNGSALLACARTRRVRSMAVVHLWVPHQSRLKSPMYAGLLHLPRLVVTPGAGTAANLRRLGISATVVPNGVYPVQQLPRSQARQELGIPDDPVVVGGIGRLHFQKGWDLFARAWPLITASHPGTVGLVIGEGNERARLERLGSGVRFVGAKLDAARFLSAVDVLVAPSRYESQGLVPIEAALAGLPTVVTDLPGLGGVDGCGVMKIPPEDPTALAGAVTRMLADLPRWTRDAEQQREQLIESFSPHKMAKTTLDLLFGL